jgi:multiple sugar transport system substrate-binding protein
MKKYFWLVLAIGVALAFMFTTAMAEQASSISNPDSVQAVQPAAKREFAATTVITMVHNQTGDGLSALQYQTLLYEIDHPDIDVRLVYTDDIFSLMSTNPDNIDIYNIDVIWPGEAYNNHWIVALDNYISSSSIITLTDFLTGTINAMTVNGHLVAIPWFTDAGLLYYRTDLLSKYGYSVPQTFEVLKTQALVIKAGEGLANGFVWQGAEYEGLTCDFLEYLWGSGGDLFIPPYQVVISSTQSINALNTMVDYLHSGVSPAATVTYGEEDTRLIFQNGDAAFMRNWPYAWALLQADGSPVKGKVGVAPMPHAVGEQSAATLGGRSLAVSSKSSHPDAAFAFIEFLTDTSQQKYNALHFAVNPTRLALYHDTDICTSNPFMCNLYNVFVNARPRPPIKNYNQFSLALFQNVYDALVGNKTSQQAILDAQKELQSIAGAHLYIPFTVRQ